MRRFIPRRPWAPLSDAEWAALAPHITCTGGPGRPLRDPRARLDAMLRNTLGDRPWRDLSEGHTKPDTLSRLFRRWTHAGLWLRLLDALAVPDAPAPLRAMETLAVPPRPPRHVDAAPRPEGEPNSPTPTASAC
jgi:transposase